MGKVKKEGNFNVNKQTVRFVQVGINGTFSWSGKNWQKRSNTTAIEITTTSGVPTEVEFPAARRVVLMRANDKPDEEVIDKIFGNYTL